MAAMAEAGVQEPSLPCTSLAAGGESQEESGWQPEAAAEEECPMRGRNLSCPEPDEHANVGDSHQPDTEGAWRELGRKRHRRRPSKRKRPWKPYTELTWEEKKRLEEREAQRASRMRAEMFAKGQPVAPYNTTQFLMEDHDLEEPDLCPPPRRPPALPPLHLDSTDEEDDSDGTGSDDPDEDQGTDFLQKDFSETYEKYHVESLQDMSKQELIREYMELEKCLSRMEEENNRLRSQHTETRLLRDLEMELEKVKEENRRLLREREQVVANSTGH